MTKMNSHSYNFNPTNWEPMYEYLPTGEMVEPLNLIGDGVELVVFCNREGRPIISVLSNNLKKCGVTHN